MKNNSFSEQMYRLYGNNIGIGVCRNITLQVTDACCLNCSYCYQTNKGNRVMTKETAKDIVDLLFRMWEEDKPGAFINKNTKALVLEFIGGEPLLNIPVMDFTIDYFWNTAIEKRHPWADNFRISISTNGVKYFEPSVQKFIEKYGDKLSLGVSIDGDKEMHDSCRCFPNGEGSWELATKAEEDYIEKRGGIPSSKITISRSNLPHLNRAADYFISKGHTQIHANCIYEEEWDLEDASILYEQLKALADKLVEKNGEVEVSFFEEDFFRPIPEQELTNWCGGGGEMLSFDPDGIAYPCLRYMESSLSDRAEPIRIGNSKDGIYKTEKEIAWLDTLNRINRRTQCDDECFYCTIAHGCSHCLAYDYEESGGFTQRSKRICPMHKSRSLANVYYWNTLYRKRGDTKRFKMHLPKEEALKIISEDEYRFLKELEKE